MRDDVDLPVTHIAREFHVQVATIQRHLRDLRRLAHLPLRQTRRAAVAALHAAGLSRSKSPANST